MNTYIHNYLLIVLLTGCWGLLGCRTAKNLSVESISGVYKLAPDHPRHSPSESCRFTLSADGTFEYFETACMGWRNGAKGSWRLVGDTIYMEASDKYCRMLFEVEEGVNGSPDSVYFEVYDASSRMDTVCSITCSKNDNSVAIWYSKFPKRQWRQHRSKVPLACFQAECLIGIHNGGRSPLYCIKDTTKNHFVVKFDRKHVARLFERNDCLVRAVIDKDRLTVLDTSYNPNLINPTGVYKKLQKQPTNPPSAR